MKCYNTGIRTIMKHLYFFEPSVSGYYSARNYFTYLPVVHYGIKLILI